MAPLSSISEELADIDGQISDIFRALSNGFQKLEKVKDSNRQSRQLEELTEKMRECKRLIKEFDREVKYGESRNSPDTNRMLNEKKQSMIKELNSYVALKKQYSSSLENKRGDLLDGPSGGEGFAEEILGIVSYMNMLKIHNSCPGELADVVKQLEEATGSVAVGLIGRSVILYRPSLTKLKTAEKKIQARKVYK